MTLQQCTQAPTEETRQQQFHLVLRQALLMIVRWIEKEYHLEKS